MNSLSTNQRSLIDHMKRSEQHAARGFQLLHGSDKARDFFYALKHEGFFAVSNNPPPQEADREGFFRIPFWPALDYLVKIARIAGQTADTDLGSALMEIVRDVTLSEPRVDNYHTFRACAEIAGAVPLACTHVDDMDMIRVWIGSKWGNDMVVPELDKGVFQRYLGEQDVRIPQLVSRALWHMTDLVPEEKRSNRLRPIADAYWLEELLKHNAERLGSRCQRLALDCFIDRLKRLFGDKYISTHTWIVRSAIEDHPQNSSWDYANNALVVGARDALGAWIESANDAAAEYVTDLLADKSQIVRRLAIQAINKHWARLAHVFAEGVTPELFDVGHLHELYNLLADRFSEMDEPLQGRVLASILQTGQVATEEARKRADAQVQNWLVAIAGKGNAVADERFAALEEALGPVREHPDLLSYTTTRWGFGEATFSREQLLGFAHDRSLVEQFGTLGPDTIQRSRKSQVDLLVETVAQEPEAFMWLIDDRPDTPRDIAYSVFAGVAKALGAKEDTLAPHRLEDVARRCLHSAINLVQLEAFWTEEVLGAEPLTPNRDWIPPKLADLGKALVANEEIDVQRRDISDIRVLNDILMSKSEGIPFEDDFMTPAINNPRGQAFESTIHALLRGCRDSDANGGRHDEVWGEFWPVFERELAQCQDTAFEVSTLCACYLNQLMYVSQQWSVERAPLIFPAKFQKNLVAAISGLSYAAISKSLYEVLQSSGVVQTALASTSVKGSGRERLIERVAIAYSWGQEPIASDVIASMFSEERLEDLTELVSTSSRWVSEKLRADQVERSLLLAASAARFGLESPRTRRLLLAKVARFIGYVELPTPEVLIWLVPVAPYAHLSHGEGDFIENVERLAGQYPSQMALVLEAFLQDYRFTYDYQGKLADAIRKIFVGGERAKALGALELLNSKSMHASLIDLLAELRGRDGR